MQRFAVVLTDGLPLAEETIKRHYDESIQLTDDVFLISEDTNVVDILDTLGLPEEDSPLKGIVFSLNGSYGGRALTSVWNWLDGAPS